MPVDSSLMHDNRYNDVATRDDPSNEVNHSEASAEKVLDLMDGCYRHAKVVIRPDDSERLNSLILSLTSKNRMVIVIPSTRMLVLEQVKEILGASPTYVKELRDNGTLRFFKHGVEQVIEAEQVFAFKDKLENDLEKAYDAVIGMDQELYFHDC